MKLIYRKSKLRRNLILVLNDAEVVSLECSNSVRSVVGHRYDLDKYKKAPDLISLDEISKNVFLIEWEH